MLNKCTAFLILMLTTVLAFGIPSAAAQTGTVMKVALWGDSTDPHQMGVRLDRESVSTGPVTFVITNEAATEKHELVVIKLDAPGQALPYLEARRKVDEGQVNALEEVEGLKPGQTETLTLTLEPGSYVLICNYDGHYRAGMWAPFTVQ